MNLFILPLLIILPPSFASSHSPSTCKASIGVDPKCTSRSPSTCKVVAGIEPTCKSAVAADPSMTYEYCTTALNSDPCAKSEDLLGLATIAAKMAIAHAESTEIRIDDLMDLEHDHSVKSKYRECLDALNDVGESLKDAFDSISAKQYAKATKLLMGSRGAVDECSRVLSDVDRRPMMGLDHDYERLAELTTDILGMVHH